MGCCYCCYAAARDVEVHEEHISHKKSVFSFVCIHWISLTCLTYTGLHPDYPLGPSNSCCSLNTPPWFVKDLPSPTTDDIEMRVCRPEADGSTQLIQ